MQPSLARALICALTVLATPSTAELVVASRYVVSDPTGDIGGLSAIDMSNDGATAVMLSDRGTLYSGVFSRDDSAAITGFIVTESRRLRHLGEDNHPDSEGLVAVPGGAAFVSTEDPTRILLYPKNRKDPAYFPDIPAGPDLSNNRGFEALAQDADGALYTVFERPDTDDNTFSVYRLADGIWDIPREIKAVRSFSIVGADFAPDGRLFILERAFSPLGFRSQIRSLDIGDPLGEPVTHFTSTLGQFDNLEGISVWVDSAGDLRLTTVSDDNFTSILRNEVVEFVLKE